MEWYIYEIHEKYPVFKTPTPSAFSWFYTLVFAVVCICIILQSTYFIRITWERTKTMEQQPHRGCEWNQKKNKTKLRHIQIDRAFCCSI